MTTFRMMSSRFVAAFLFSLAFFVTASPTLQAASTEPTVFASGVISTGREFTITFSPDGREAFFSRFAPGERTHIYCSRLVGGNWQIAEKVTFSNDLWSDLDPFITRDGKRMFFISTRPHDASRPADGKDMDIWVVERAGKDWGVPHVVENVNSDGKEGSPSVARDGTLYFFSDRQQGANKNSLYESRWIDGHYTAPVRLPAPVNSDASDTSPFITPNGKMLLFYSTRTGGYGKADLYVSFRKHGKWQILVNLGPEVNTADSEYNPELSLDGRQLFFGRNGRIYALPTSAVPCLRRGLAKFFHDASHRWL
jgi:Periplasmic component of the Tol biopolymer transport system